MVKTRDLGFAYQFSKQGVINILRQGRNVSNLRGKKASQAALQLEELDFAGQQQLLARLTGNYKRGNEKHNKS